MRLAQYLKGAREERQPKNEITECIFIIIMVICKETSLTSGFWRHIWFEWCCKWPEHSTRIYIGMLADAVAITNQHTHDIYELWKTAAFCRIYIKRAHVTGRALLIIVSCVFISAGDRRCGHCRQRSTLSLSLSWLPIGRCIFFSCSYFFVGAVRGRNHVVVAAPVVRGYIETEFRCRRWHDGSCRCGHWAIIDLLSLTRRNALDPQGAATIFSAAEGLIRLYLFIL